MRLSTKQVPFANIAGATLRSLWCAWVQSLLVLLEDADAICRQLNHVFALSCVFKIFKKIEKPAACEMRSVICFLNARNIKLADIHRQLCEVYGEDAMSDSMVRRWVGHFNDGCENVHDDPWSDRPSVVNEDLVRVLEEKSQENRRFTICHFPCIFHKFQGHFFTTLCPINFVFGNRVHTGCQRYLQMNTK
jgi:hypothetical protein